MEHGSNLKKQEKSDFLSGNRTWSAFIRSIRLFRVLLPLIYAILLLTQLDLF